MTPAARVSASIAVLDQVLAGSAAEQALTNWARQARYAGSSDRSAVRDMVFQVLRCKRSYAVLGGAMSGRGLVLGMVRDQLLDADALFSGDTYAPAVISAEERASGTPPNGADKHDLPDWLWTRFCAALGRDAAAEAAQQLRQRAPITLRVNMRKGSRDTARELLLKEGVTCENVEGVSTALLVTDGARKVGRSTAFMKGLVELQDASSQAAMLSLSIARESHVLDYCAGGGGKTLALAALHNAHWYVHDAAPKRMTDLPARAARAGVEVTALNHQHVLTNAPYHLVLCDVPCSGSGTWRRTPDAKWRLTPSALRTYTETQCEILGQAKDLVSQSGVLAYSTCSVLNEENEDQVTAFLHANPAWQVTFQKRWPVSNIGDGFFLTVFAQT